MRVKKNEKKRLTVRTVIYYEHCVVVEQGENNRSENKRSEEWNMRTKGVATKT